MRYYNGHLTLRLPIGPLLKLMLGTLAVLYVVTAAIHLSNGLSVDRALRGPFMDARVALSCPTDPGIIWEFVNRTQLEDLSLRLAELFGEDFRKLCD